MSPCTGSPFARSWSVFLPKPTAWDLNFEKPSDLEGTCVSGLPGHLEFTTLALGLVATGKHPSKLSLGSVDDKSARRLRGGSGIPPLFNSMAETLPILDAFSKTCCDLTHLTLHMGTYMYQRFPMQTFYPDLTGLGYFLDSLIALQTLELVLPARCAIFHQYYNYDNIFKIKDGIWPDLHTMKLHNLAIGTRDLVKLFAEAFPSLRSLSIAAICLIEGRWVWILEFMREHMQLDTFYIAQYSGLLYPGDEVRDAYEYYESDLTKSDRHREYVQSYVVHGGLHPDTVDWEFLNNETNDGEEGDQNSEEDDQNSEEGYQNSEEHEQHDKRNSHVSTEIEEEAETAEYSQRYYMELQEREAKSAAYRQRYSMELQEFLQTKAEA